MPKTVSKEKVLFQDMQNVTLNGRNVALPTAVLETGIVGWNVSIAPVVLEEGENGYVTRDGEQETLLVKTVREGSKENVVWSTAGKVYGGDWQVIITVAQIKGRRARRSIVIRT